MLRPVRPLRRSVDTSSRRSSNTTSAQESAAPHRANQRSRSPLNTPALSAISGVKATTSAGFDTHLEFENGAAVAVPSLQPRLPDLQARHDCSTRPSPQRKSFHCSFKQGFAEMNLRAASSTTCVKGNEADTRVSCAARSPLAFETPHTRCDCDSAPSQRASALPVAARRLFTSDEIDHLRFDARVEYTQGRRLQERKNVIHEEAEQRRLISTDALGQAHALQDLEKRRREALLRAKSDEALPLLYLEQRIQARIASDYALQDTELRQQGRLAWIEQVANSKTAGAQTQTSNAERRAASHRFRAALTFIVVEERNLRSSLQAEADHNWEALLRDEEASKAETAQRALERFLNTPEQLALTAERERRERRQAKMAAKQRKLFQEQQDSFIRGCRHGAGGASVFDGEAPKKICGRCRVKLDEDLGYYVSLDRGTKTHPPPQFIAKESARQDANVK